MKIIKFKAVLINQPFVVKQAVYVLRLFFFSTGNRDDRRRRLLHELLVKAWYLSDKCYRLDFLLDWPHFLHFLSRHSKGHLQSAKQHHCAGSWWLQERNSGGDHFLLRSLCHFFDVSMKIKKSFFCPATFTWLTLTSILPLFITGTLQSPTQWCTCAAVVMSKISPRSKWRWFALMEQPPRSHIFTSTPAAARYPNAQKSRGAEGAWALNCPWEGRVNFTSEGNTMIYLKSFFFSNNLCSASFLLLSIFMVIILL